MKKQSRRERTEFRLHAISDPRARCVVRELARRPPQDEPCSERQEARYALALRSGLDANAARAWASWPGAAGTWSARALSLVPETVQGVCALDRWVLRCEQLVALVLLGTSPAERPMPGRKGGARRPHSRVGPRPTLVKGRPQVVSKVRVVQSPPLTEPRLRGAQAPPKPLNQGVDESAFPDRPRGWSTSDWLGSKS
jgi:hypothetical protein